MVPKGAILEQIFTLEEIPSGRYTMALRDLLSSHGFVQHPFSTWKAEDEKDLAKWFIKPPFFDDILGDGRPNSNLIFGVPGGGKSALRKMLEAQLLTAFPSALVIRYSAFSRVLAASGPRPRLHDHVEELLLLGTIGLLALW